MQRPSDKRATKAPTVRCELVTDFKRLDQLSLDWQRLTSSDQHAEIFQSWQWSRASCKAYGSISSLCSPVVYEGGQVIGILPLARRGAVIEFLGLPDADYNDIICEEHSTSKVLAAALESILKLSPMWESCVFDNLSARSRIVRYWRTLSPHLRHHLQLTFQHPSPSIIFNDNKDEIISRLVKMRDLKRHYNKLCKRGHLAFRYLESRDEAREHLGAAPFVQIVELVDLRADAERVEDSVLPRVRHTGGLTGLSDEPGVPTKQKVHPLQTHVRCQLLVLFTGRCAAPLPFQRRARDGYQGIRFFRRGRSVQAAIHEPPPAELHTSSGWTSCGVMFQAACPSCPARDPAETEVEGLSQGCGFSSEESRFADGSICEERRLIALLLQCPAHGTPQYHLDAR